MSAVASPFTADEQKKFDAQVGPILERYPEANRAAALIPILRVAQDLHGWLKPEAMDYVAQVVGVPGTRVREVVTFYTMFRLKPVGRTHVGVCVNLACWLRGSDELVEVCRSRMGDTQQQPANGGAESWAEIECLASCGTAPTIMINDEYFENITPQQLAAELDKRRK